MDPFDELLSLTDRPNAERAIFVTSTALAHPRKLLALLAGFRDVTLALTPQDGVDAWLLDHPHINDTRSTTEEDLLDRPQRTRDWVEGKAVRLVWQLGADDCELEDIHERLSLARAPYGLSSTVPDGTLVLFCLRSSVAPLCALVAEVVPTARLSDVGGLTERALDAMLASVDHQRRALRQVAAARRLGELSRTMHGFLGVEWDRVIAPLRQLGAGAQLSFFLNPKGSLAVPGVGEEPGRPRTPLQALADGNVDAVVRAAFGYVGR